MKKLLIAHLALFGANLIYGLNYVIAKGIMPDFLQPRVIILFRVVGASIIFWVVSSFFKTEKIDKKDFPRLMLSAFFGIALNQIMFFEGLNLTTPINASIIMVGTPILVLVLSHFLISDKITVNKLIGIMLGAAGAGYLILTQGNISFSSSTFVGNILILINAAAYATFLVIVKPLMKKYNALTIMKWVFLFGTIYVIPLSINLALKADYAAIPFRIWMSVSYVILFTTVLAYFLNNFSLKTVSPTVNSAYIYLQPFLATIFALSVNEDRITWTKVIAAILIFLGVYFASIRKVQIKK
ncbi:MAG: EamA family transporter [Marinilabiliales bacterium]|nr:MAG: EamA family transporter [Marinilabiliales bacterium]